MLLIVLCFLCAELWCKNCMVSVVHDIKGAPESSASLVDKKRHLFLAQFSKVTNYFVGGKIILQSHGERRVARIVAVQPLYDLCTLQLEEGNGAFPRCEEVRFVDSKALTATSGFKQVLDFVSDSVEKSIMFYASHDYQSHKGFPGQSVGSPDLASEPAALYLNENDEAYAINTLAGWVPCRVVKELMEDTEHVLSGGKRRDFYFLKGLSFRYMAPWEKHIFMGESGYEEGILVSEKMLYSDVALKVGDVIVSCDGRPVKTVTDFVCMMQRKPRSELKIVRFGVEKTLSVCLTKVDCRVHPYLAQVGQFFIRVNQYLSLRYGLKENSLCFIQKPGKNPPYIDNVFEINGDRVYTSNADEWIKNKNGVVLTPIFIVLARSDDTFLSSERVLRSQEKVVRMEPYDPWLNLQYCG
ncbi:MAG: hypothetical protein OXC30_05725 [Alphaproteobacteria bacterium]|nr:hypothetical protein [Alphaproteobacteria bacterium]